MANKKFPSECIERVSPTFLDKLLIWNSETGESDNFVFIQKLYDIFTTLRDIVSVIKTSTEGLVDTYTITYHDGATSTFQVTNGEKGDTGNGIESIAKTSTTGLVDTYTITFTESDPTTFTVTNGKGISSISKTSTSGITDTYTITYTDGATSSYSVVNGKGITNIEKTSTSGLVDTYTITYNDGSPSSFTVSNGNGITTIVKTGTEGLVDTYTITLNDGSTTTFTVTNGATPEIKQTTGTSEDDVMSQKATTDELALKADKTELAQLAGEMNLLDAVHGAKIKDIENVLSTANLNQSAQLSVSGRKTISLPKNASNGGMSVKLEGLTAENEAVNGNFENGLISPFSKVDGGGGASTLAINSSTPISGNYDIRLTIITPSTVGGRPYLTGLNRAENIGDKIYLHFYAKILSGIPAIAGINNGASVTGIYGGDVINGRNTRIIDVVGISGDLGLIYFNSLSVWDMQMDNFMRINLTETFGAGNEPTKEQCDIIFSDYFEGVKSFEPTGRVRSVGKNLFNKYKHTVVTGSRYTDTGAAANITSYTRVETPIKVQPSTTYYDEGQRQASSYVVFLDKNKNIIGTGGNSASSFTTPTNCVYVKPCFYNLNGRTVENYYIVRGATAVTYESYKETSLYLTAPELRSNGTVKDEIRKGGNGYELVKRVGVGTLGSELIVNGGFDTEATWLKQAGWTISGDSANYDATSNTVNIRQAITLELNSYYEVKFTVLSGTARISINNMVGGNIGFSSTYNYSVGTHTIRFKASATNGIAIFAYNTDGGTAFSLDNFSTKKINANDGVIADTSMFTVLGSNIHYTLATPVITPISYGGILNSAGNGTVYHEPIIADAGVYDTKMDILLTDYPIATIEEIIKHENGVDTYLNVATAVIAGDGLSFTHPDLASGDLVLFTYAFDKESTNGNITATFYDSNVVKIDTVTGKAYRINEVVTDGVLTRTLTEV
jgi:hypothetical protein